MFWYFQCIKTVFQNIGGIQGAYSSYKKYVPPVIAFLQTWFLVVLLAYASIPVMYCMGVSSV